MCIFGRIMSLFGNIFSILFFKFWELLDILDIDRSWIRGTVGVHINLYFTYPCTTKWCGYIAFTPSVRPSIPRAVSALWLVVYCMRGRYVANHFQVSMPIGQWLRSHGSFGFWRSGILVDHHQQFKVENYKINMAMSHVLNTKSHGYEALM